MNHRTLTRFTGIWLFAISCFFSSHTQGQSRGCALEIPPSENFIDGHGNASAVQPGDTICLMPGNRSFLWIRYLHGTPEAPIVIINRSGAVDLTNFYYGAKIDSCSHVKLSGKGVPYIYYGIRIHNIDGGGFSIEGLSTDIEVEGLDITGTVFVGMFAKHDPDCSFNSTRDKYVMRNISIHDNYIHQTGMEGFYIGSSFYTGYVLNCNGKDTLVYPHVIKGLKVYNNRLEYNGWDGIQVSSADSGCYIYNNYIAYDSDSAVYNQMSGIIMGGGSKCDCYNNIITDGKGVGINVFGLGGQKIYNNLIVRAGRTFPDPYPLMSGIYAGEVETPPENGFLIANNTIILPKVFGIHFKNLSSSGNVAINNIIIAPGVNFFDGENITVVNNYTSMDPVFDQFVDPANGNFDLKPWSPAVNAAVPMSFLLTYDLLNRLRPFAQVNDIGAYECHDSSLIAIPVHSRKLTAQLDILQTENPGTLRIIYFTPFHGAIRIDLYDMSGKLVHPVVNEIHPPGEYQKEMVTGTLKSGLYMVTLSIRSETITKKIQLYK